MATITGKTKNSEKEVQKSKPIFCLPLSFQGHLMLLGPSVKDRNPGGSKEGRAFANILTFFLQSKIKDYVGHESQEMKSKDIGEKEQKMDPIFGDFSLWHMLADK